MMYRVVLVAFGLFTCSSIALNAQPVDSGDGSTPTTTDPATKTAIDEINAKTALQKAATDQAAQEEKLVKAREDLAKSKLGTITGQQTYTGAVQGETGKAEALLLVTKSAIDSALPIRTAIQPALKVYNLSDVVILTDPAQLGVSDAILFDVRRDALKQLGVAAQIQFEQAMHNVPDAPPTPADNGERIAMPALTVVNTAIDSLAKLGSYFNSNYKFGDIAPDPTADLLAAAVVQSFAHCTTRPRFFIPARSSAADAQHLRMLLGELHAVNIQAVGNNAAATSLAAQLRTNANGKAHILAAAARLDGAATAAASVSTAYQSLMNDLTAAPEAGKEPMAVRIVKQQQLQDKLANKALILLLTGKQAAAYYTKSSLWTFIGGAPVYTMAGTSTSYTLMDSTGLVLAGGAVADHAGYRSVSQVEKLFGRAPVATAGSGQCA